MPRLSIDRFQQRDLVVIIVDGELARETRADLGKRIAIATQHSYAERMKGRNQRACRSRWSPSRLLTRLAHLLGGLVGERDGQHRGTRHMMRGNQVRDAIRDDASLTASCSGKQQHRTFDMRNGFTLLGIQTF